MPDASSVSTTIHPVTGQRLVRFRPRVATAAAAGHRARAVVTVPAQPTAVILAAWLSQVDAVRGLKRIGASKPSAAAMAKALEDLREAGEAVMARVRQSYADAVQ